MSIWILICVVNLLKAVASSNNTIVFEKVYFHQVISFPSSLSNETAIIQTLAEISIQNCIDECKRLRVCDFINFHVRTHLCDIIRSKNSSGNAQVLRSPGYAYSSKTDWNMNVFMEECSFCAESERCELEATPTLCVREACGPPGPVSDTMLYGNMYRTSDTIIYQCRDNYTKSNGTSFSSTCQNDGNWTVVNITCTNESDISCVPMYQVAFNETVLSDNTNFKFLVTTSQMKHAEALIFCEERCGRLVEVLTYSKFSFLVSFLSSHTEYGGDFFIDGSYDSLSGKWVTSSGTEIQHDYSMWESNPKYFSSDQPCIRMRQGSQYKINTHQCSVSYGAICEKL